MPNPYAVQVNGGDVYPILTSLEVVRGLGRRSTARLKFTSAPTVGQSVGVWDGAGARIFGGEIDEISPVPLSVRLNTIQYEALCASYEIRTDRRLVTAAVYGQTFIADAATDILHSAGHGLANDQTIRTATTGTLPAGLAVDTTYHVINSAADTFKLSATQGGGSINITDGGTGAHSTLWLAGDIVLDAIANYAPSEQITTAGVEDGVFVEKRSYDGMMVSAIMDDLAPLCGFIWYIDPDVDLFFGPRSTNAAPFNITATSAIRRPILRNTREQYRNRQHSRYSFAAVSPTVESFAGDGSAREFWLADRAIQIDSITVDDVAQTFGINGTDSSLQWYFAPGESLIRHEPRGRTWVPDFNTEVITAYAHGRVNDDTLQFLTTVTLPDPLALGVTYHIITATENTFQVAATQGGAAINITDEGTGIHFIQVEPLDNTQTLKVTYRILGSNILQRDNSGEQTARATIEGGSGIHAAIMDDSANTSAASAIELADAQLNALDEIAQEFTYETELNGMVPGQLQTVTIAALDLSAVDFLVDQVTVRALGSASLRYTVREKSIDLLQDWVDYFRSLSQGGGGGGAVVGSGPASGGGGGESAAPPVPPSHVTSLSFDAVDYTDPAFAQITGTAAVPAAFNDFSGCDAYLVVDPSGSPSEPIYLGHQWHDPTDTTGPFAFELRVPRPDDAPTWRIRMVARNNQVAADYAGAPYDDLSITARPDVAETSQDQPGSGDLTLVGGAAEYHSSASGKPNVRVQIEVDPNPTGATLYTGWVNKVSDDPDTAKWVINMPVDKGGSPTVLDMSTLEQPEANKDWYFYVTASNTGFYEPPSATSAKLSVSILAVAAPDQISNWSYAIVPAGLDASGVPQYYLDLTFDMPSDPRYFTSEIDRRWANDSGFSSWATGWSVIPVMNLGSHQTRGATSVTERHGPYAYGTDVQYQQFRAQAVARAHDSDGDLYVNAASAPTLNITIPASDGLDLSAVDASTLGYGLTKDSSTSKLKMSSRTLLQNGSFYDDLEHWNGDATISVAEFHTGIQSAELETTGGQYSVIYSDSLQCSPGNQIYFDAWVNKDGSANGDLRLFFRFRDKDLVQIGSAISGALSISTGVWKFVSLSGTVPAGVTWYDVQIHSDNQTAGSYWVDDLTVRFRVSEEQIQDEAVSIDKINSVVIQGGFTRTSTGFKFGTTDLSNAILNPDFDDDFDHWTLGGTDPTISTGEYYAGLNQQSCKLFATGSPADSQVDSTPVACRPGDQFYAEAWIKVVSGTARAFLWCVDSNEDLTDWQTLGAATSGSWTKYSGVITAPANTVSIQVNCDLTNAAGEAYVDSVVLRPMVSNEIQLADEILATLAKFGATVRPIKIVSSLPGLPDAEYPSGSAVIDTTNGKLYRNNGGSWTKAVDQTDVTSLAVAVLQAGTINAAITMTAPSIAIVSGSIQVKINSTDYVQVRNTSTGIYTKMTGSGMEIEDTNSPYEFGLYNNSFMVLISGGNNSVSISQDASGRGSASFNDAGTPKVTITTSFGGRVNVVDSYYRNGVAGLTGSIPNTFTSIAVAGGIITGYT